MKTTEICESLCRETVESLGFTLCDVEFKKEYADWVLTFFIDKDGGVTIDDCETVSRALEPVLDAADPIEQAYVLSVSSLGIDRPLKKEADFIRNIGKELEIKLYSPKAVQGGKAAKEFTGILQSNAEDSFTVVMENGQTAVFTKKEVALVRPYIRF